MKLWLLALLCLCSLSAQTPYQPGGGSGSSGGGIAEIPYEYEFTGTSTAVAKAVHNKGNYPHVRLFSGGSEIPLTYSLSSGDVLIENLVSGTYLVRIVEGTNSGTPYEEEFTGTSVTINQSTHQKGQHPTVLLFLNGTLIPAVATGFDTGNITFSGLTSGTYRVKIY
jgi:hypothetical protein